MLLLDHLDRVDNRLRVAVRRVNHDEVDAGFFEMRDPFFRIRSDTDGRADAQPAMGILASIRIFDPLLDVLDGDQSLEFALLVDDWQLLDPMLMQDFAGLFEAGPFRRRDQFVPLHDLGHLEIQAGLEPEIAIRQDANQFLILGDGDARDAVLGHQLVGVADGLIRRDRDRIQNHSAFGFLDPVDFRRLIGGAQDPVNDADSPFTRHGDRQPRFCDRVHCGADDGDIDLDVPREVRADIDFAGQDAGFRWHQNHIVIRESEAWFFLEHSPPWPGPSGLLGLLRFLDFRRCFRCFLQPLAAFVSRHELLNAGVAAVDDEHAASRIDRKAIREIELAVAVAVPAPLREEVAFFVEFFDAMIAGVRDVHVPGCVDRNAPGRPQLSGLLRQGAARVPRLRTAAPLCQ